MLLSERDRVILWGYNTTILVDYTTNYDLSTDFSLWVFNYQGGSLTQVGTLAITGAL
jgi:hypothetical protein